MNGKPWTPDHTATLKRMAGIFSDAEIAQATGHATVTVKCRRTLLDLPAYTPRQSTWTRRDCLLNAAAGLTF